MTSEPRVVDGGASPDEDTAYIQEVFGSGGALARVIPGYQPRLGQIAMARQIDRAIRDRHHIVVEGPTGVGKSAAYSVPAAYHAVNHERRVCIVTANKTLQAQIYQKDLPAIQAATGWPFRFALRKGMDNYLCTRDLEEGRWRGAEFEEGVTEEERGKIRRTATWANETDSGDYEASPGLPRRLWSFFSTNREACDGGKCEFIDDCYVKKAKDISAQAHITVTNYHLFYHHVQHKLRGGKGWILPPFDIAILDEAHNAASIARDFFGDEVTFGGLYRCVTNMHMVTVHRFKQRGERLRDLILAETRTLWDELARRAREEEHIFTKGEDCPSLALEHELAEGERFYTELASAMTGQTTQDGGEEQYKKLARACATNRGKLEMFRTEPGIEREPHHRKVYFIDGSGKEEKGKWVKLKSKGLIVGPYLDEAVFSVIPTVIQTSATLAVEGGRGPFDYYRTEMGLKDRVGVDELRVSSPFDWEKQALLVVPSSMVDYRDPLWLGQVAESFARIVRDVKGRTLGLFTSFRVLRHVASHLRSSGLPYTILVQGEGTNAELQRRFREEVGSVLLGTESFAEGVDIQGEACSCVVLDKIPFIPPNDPLLKGLEQFEDNVFSKYQVPEAVISFKQRVGRLIRTVKDVGVIVVLDNRIHTKGYGKQFLRSIPPIRVSKDLAEIEPFLRGVGAL